MQQGANEFSQAQNLAERRLELDARPKTYKPEEDKIIMVEDAEGNKTPRRESDLAREADAEIMRRKTDAAQNKLAEINAALEKDPNNAALKKSQSEYKQALGIK